MTLDHAAARSLPARERVVVAALLVALTVLAWAYTAHHAHTMRVTAHVAAPGWSAAQALLTFLMWAVMMAAMMLPSAGPMITAFATINHRRRERGAAHVPLAVFLAGYLVVWSAFSLAATLLQWTMQASGALDAMLTSTSAAMSAALFLMAGAYQFSALKKRCLAWCRTPMGFILSEWRDGAAGAAVMGMRHGMFCAGCCAALMMLLFAVGVMDLRWVAALSVAVAAERMLPDPGLWQRAIGAACVAAGLGFAAAMLAA